MHPRHRRPFRNKNHDPQKAGRPAGRFWHRIGLAGSFAGIPLLVLGLIAGTGGAAVAEGATGTIEITLSLHGTAGSGSTSGAVFAVSPDPATGRAGSSADEPMGPGGTVTVAGAQPGDYTVTQTKAPDGYAVPSDSTLPTQTLTAGQTLSFTFTDSPAGQGTDAQDTGAAGQGAAGQGATGQDPQGTDPAGQDSAGQDSAGQDSAGQDPAGQEPAGQDPAGQDPAGQGTTGQNAPDPNSQDPSGQDPSPQALAARGPGGQGADPTIIVKAGGVRTGTMGSSTVGAAPDGTVYQAVPVTSSHGPAGGPWQCTLAGGTCQISVPAGYAWDVSAASVPGGWYTNPTLGTGGTGADQQSYAFRTARLNGTDTYTVPTQNGLDNETDTDLYSNDGYQDNRSSSATSYSGQLAVSRSDPAPVQQCGQDIALVLDHSGSMGDAPNGHQVTQNNPSKWTLLKGAVHQITAGLTGTPSRLAVYGFANTADSGHSGLISMATSAGADHVNSYVASMSASGGTNWDEGLYQVAQSGQHYDLVIFLTDGAPTLYGHSSHHALGAYGYANSTTFRYVDEGVFSANAIKDAGMPLVAVGVGLPDTAAVNLEAVSSQDAGSDYYSETGDSFVQRLVSLASGACQGTLTIQKNIEDAQGDVVSPAPETANGWQFTATITGSGNSITPGSVTTAAHNDQNGFAQAAVTITGTGSATIGVTEDIPAGSGYTFAGAACTVNGKSVTTTVSGTTASFSAAAQDELACTFTNKPTGATVTVTKIWQIDDSGGDPVASYTLPDDAGSLPAGLTANPKVGQAGTDWGAAVSGFTAGQQVPITETGAGVDHAQLPGCTMNSSAVTQANGKTVTAAAGALPYSASLKAGSNQYTITNTVTCTQTLALVKKVGFGGASPSAWTLTAAGPHGTGPTGSYTGPGSVQASVPAGTTYTLGESGGPSDAAAYVPAGPWQCTDKAGAVDVAGTDSAPTVTIPLGQNVTCTVTNTTAQIVLLKYVAGGGLQPGDFTLHADPSGSMPAGRTLPSHHAAGAWGDDANGQPAPEGGLGAIPAANTFDVYPGQSYTLGEGSNDSGTAYLGLGLQKWDGSAWQPVTGDTVTAPAAGVQAVYRFTNSAVPALTLPFTGGPGRAPYLAGGLAVLLLGAGLAAWRRRRTS